MAFLEETETWEPGVYEFTDDDVIDGGPDGTDNVPTRQLANRTGWLKAQIEALSNGKQPLDETLTAIAALAIVADRLIYSTGPDTFAMTPLSAFIRTLLDDADAATARATLGAISQAQLDAAINGLLNGAGPALDTLNELAAALGNDANFAATVNNSIALRLAITDYQKAAAATAAAGGTADAITAVFAPAITTDLAGRIPTVTVMIIAQAANTGAGLTIDIGTGAFGVVKGAGAAIVAGDVHGAGHCIMIRGVRGANAAADKWVLLNPATGILQRAQIQPITASVAANALTVGLNPTILDFRSAVLSSGTVNNRFIGNALSLVVPSGATLGTVSGQAARLMLLAIDYAGTVELAVVNLAGGNNLDETTLISTTAISAAATAANVIYSTTARANVPFRVVGCVDSTQAAAGTWASAPSAVQGVGGQALAAMSSLGFAQSWTDVTPSRAIGTTYYNTTGRPIFVSVEFNSANNSTTTQIYVNGAPVDWASGSGAGSYMYTIRAIVPPGASYSVSGGSPTKQNWIELR